MPIHPGWAIALVVIVLILFGVGRLPQVGGALGKGIADFRRNLRGDEQPPAGGSGKEPAPPK